ncbi:MAG: hypothetical protein ACTSRS_16345 [Candidatus Helarchaeota archaeon]
MAREALIKRILGHFQNLVQHSKRPYEPTPTHLQKRLLTPFCENISKLIEKGTKNDFELVIRGISHICKKQIHEN